MASSSSAFRSHCETNISGEMDHMGTYFYPRQRTNSLFMYALRISVRSLHYFRCLGKGNAEPDRNSHQFCNRILHRISESNVLPGFSQVSFYWRSVFHLVYKTGAFPLYAKLLYCLRFCRQVPLSPALYDVEMSEGLFTFHIKS